MLEKKNDALIAAKAVLARYGGICGMTLHRWVRDPDLNFPKRLLINGRRYWRLSELLAWASADQMPSILRRNNHASHGRRSYACCELKTLRAPIPASRSGRSRTASSDLWPSAAGFAFRVNDIWPEGIRAWPF
jgi:hypothetical protein